MVTRIVQQLNQSIMRLNWLLKCQIVPPFSMRFHCSPIRTNWSNRPEKHDFVFNAC